MLLHNYLQQIFTHNLIIECQFILDLDDEFSFFLIFLCLT